jgi:hypothetical protein
VREIRPLRLTWRELETWPWWNCEPNTQSKESGWKPSTYRARASSRPYLREARGAIPRAYSPKPQLVGVNVDPSTAEAIGDWHYWVAQRYSF